MYQSGQLSVVMHHEEMSTNQGRLSFPLVKETKKLGMVRVHLPRKAIHQKRIQLERLCRNLK